MDPLSISASVLAVITAAIQSTNSLCETIKRFKDRNKTLRRLQDELEDLLNILNSISQVIHDDTSMLGLLQGPIDRCSRVCHDFEGSMKKFNEKSKTGFRDWTKMEFMRGDINDFIDTVSGYKSTISIGLGTITMHNSKVTHQVLQEYNEMIKDTSYNLELHLQRIDGKLAQFPTENTNFPGKGTDLQDERAVTEQCIRICMDASSYIKSLTNQEPCLSPETSSTTSEHIRGDAFEAQNLTRRTLDENRESFIETISHLQQRLNALVTNGESEVNERIRLQEDISISKQCLDVCKVASEVSHQKIYRVGEVIADGDSDQVVVTTLADLFDVRKAISKSNSAQLVGSMTPESLHHVIDKRYNSRFATFDTRVAHSDVASSALPSAIRKSKLSHTAQGQSTETEARLGRPLPNEMRKRMMQGDNSDENNQ